MKTLHAFIFLLTPFFFTMFGCSESRGFVLPEGDVAAGERVFVNLYCNQCHSIGEVIWQGGPEDVEVKLGGRVTTLRTYGELVTSVINPSHKIASKYLKENVTTAVGTSKMQIYNEIMTVQELVDLVAFLQSEYELTVPENPYHYQYW